MSVRLVVEGHEIGDADHVDDIDEEVRTALSTNALDSVLELGMIFLPLKCTQVGVITRSLRFQFLFQILVTLATWML